MTLIDLANKHKTDKKVPDGIKCQNGLYGHGYVIHYEKLFKDRKIDNLLEIGVSFGGSIRMWNEYLPESNITGIDINEIRCKKCLLENSKVRIMLGDQSDISFLNTLCDRKYDVIIDDGCHISKHQLISFNVLFEYVTPGGLYIIEDLHASAAKETQDIFKRKCENTCEISKTNIDKIDKIEFFERNKFCVIHKRIVEKG